MNVSALEVNLIQRVAVGDILRRRSRDSANLEALVDFEGGQRRSLTYFQLNQRVNQLSHGLRQRGLQAGDRIALFGTNQLDFVVSLFACYKAGIVVVPINFLQNPDTIHYNLSHAEVKAVIYELALETIVDASTVKDLPNLQQRLIFGSEKSKADICFDELLDGQPTTELNDCIINDRDTAHIIYTSGTTSNPKGVETSHLALVMSSLSNPLSIGAEKHHSLLTVLPLFHCAALSFLYGCMQLSGSIVMRPNFDPVEVAELLEKEKIYTTALLPMMWRAMLQLPDIQQRDFSALTTAVYAMAPMDAETLEQLRATFDCPFHLGSGQTEFAPMACAYYDETPTEFGAGNYWGEPNICADQAIIDDHGNEVPQGEIGEICWRGPQVMTGYLKNTEATEEAQQFGWHHSGDLGLIDNEGQMLFVDRKKDTIKSGGENVSSMKVEQALLSHPAIVQAAAFGVPHPRWDEAVVACIQLAPDTSPSEEEIIAHCKQSLGGFETPKRVVVTEAFPMTSTGKVRKVELRQEYSKLFT
ncbi:acyl-CoA synthetase [Maricurvus nonylphenolicus]